MTFGKKIKTLRTLKGYTLQELAQRSGLCIMTLSKLENDSHSPSALTVRKLAVTLDGDFEELLTLASK